MKKLFIIFFFLPLTYISMAQVGIGTSSPDASARLQIDANAATNAKGFLIPRVTATEKSSIVSPATGLMVYQTDGSKGFYYYDGTAWNLLTVATSSVPYTGATAAVNLGAYDLTVNGITVGKGAASISSNTAIGLSALASNTTGINNVASGSEALNKNTTGSYNIASGYQALYANTTGSTNIANGYQALYANTTGNFNIASGYRALYSNTTGLNNIASGYRALYSNTTGNNNMASGYESLYDNTTGNNNVASGYQSLSFNTTGSDNVASGYQSLYKNTTGNLNTANGYQALNKNITGFNNTANGYQALYANINGRNNTAIGSSALYNNTSGNNNVASGYYALVNNNSGYNNVASGYYALVNNNSGYNNTAIGYNAGSNLISGNNNTLIGFDAQPSTSVINNEITLGNSSVVSLRCADQSISSLSDRRDKTDITPIVEGLAFLKQLNPVSFTWNTRDKAKVGIKSAGFIAQELLALQKQSNIGDNLNLVSENNPEKLEARYGNLLPVIVKAIQEESAEKDKEILVLKIKSTEKDAEIDALKQRLDALEKRFNQMLTKSNK